MSTLSDKPNARELLREARAELAKAHDHLMELTTKLPMQYFRLVDGNIIQAEDCLINQLDAYLAAPSGVEIDTSCSESWGGADTCHAYNNGECMNAIKCDGKLNYPAKPKTAAPSESAMEVVEKIREPTMISPTDVSMVPEGLAITYRTDWKLTKSAAAALIEGLQRRVPRKMLEEIFEQYPCYIPGKEPNAVRICIDAIAAKHGVEVF